MNRRAKTEMVEFELRCESFLLLLPLPLPFPPPTRSEAAAVSAVIVYRRLLLLCGCESQDSVGDCNSRMKYGGGDDDAEDTFDLR